MSATETTAAAPSPTRPRSDWVDTVKGVAIVLVVLGHAWRGSEKAGLFSDMPSGLYEAVDERIYAFHMPLFFLLSGLFLLRSVEKSEPVAFLRSRASRLLWPLVLWTYLFTANKLVAGSFANSPLEAGDIPKFPIPGRWQFWFLWALFIVHMLLMLLRPVLIPLETRTKALWALFAGSIALSLVGLPDAVSKWTNEAEHFLPFFVVGLLIGHYKLIRPATTPVALAGLAVFLVALAAQPQFDGGWARLTFGIVLSVSLMAAISRLVDVSPAVHKAFLYLGTASMVIFLSHTIFTASIRIALQKVGIDSLPIHLVLGVVLGIAFPLVLNQLIHRYGKPQWFGI